MLKKLTHLPGRIAGRMGNRFIIILIGITAAFTLAGVIGLVYLIKPEIILPQQTAKVNDCASCHTEIHAGWHQGAHGDTQSKNALSQGSNCLACHKETSNEIVNVNNTATSSFSDFWVKQGMPNECPICHVTGYDETTNTWKSDGITCEACHGTIPEDHPDNATVSINSAAENCRTCHTDDRFDWGKWKESVHFQNSMVCIDCHNPHTTALKTVENSQGAAYDVCGNCHKKIAKSSEHSIHTKIGVGCTDCHLGEPKGNDDFHQIPDHDFKPKIETCNKCHTDQMHTEGESKLSNTPRIFSHVDASVLKKDASSIEPLTGLFPNSIRFVAVAMVLGVISGASLRKSVFRKRR